MTTAKLVGTILTVFLIIAGAAVAVLGATIPHLGVVFSGLGIAVISTIGLVMSLKR